MAARRLAVVVCSRNRVALLEQALASLDVAARRLAGVEIVAIDNASTDATPELLARWQAAAPGRSTLRVTGTGKAGALNAYLRGSQADVVAFTDDDVIVDPDWLVALDRSFVGRPEFAAAAGPIRVPPAVTDAETLRRIALYPTLPFWEIPSGVRLTQLLGANMAVRRPVFEQVGYFDERLGPGATGMGEETDLSQRIVAAGLRIGYVPDAVVYHEVDERRLTLDALCAQQRSVARSRFVMRAGRESRLDLALRFAEAWVAWSAAGLTGNFSRRVRARGRMAFYSELLRLVGQGGSVPPRA